MPSRGAGEFVSRIKDAVLEVTNALHNWRADPSPENTVFVTVAVQRVCGFALELEAILHANEASTEAVTAMQHLEALIVGQLCACGHLKAFHLPHCVGVKGDARCECSAFQDAPSP